MKKIRAVAAIIISVALIAGTSGCGLITKTPQAKDKAAVAVVNGEKITLADYNTKFSQTEKQYETMYGADFFTKQPKYLTQLKDQVYQQMIQQKVMLDKAKELNMMYDDKAVAAEADKQIKATITKMGGQKQYDAQLKQAKMTPDSYRKLLIDDLKVNLPLQKLYNSITAGAMVTDQEITNEYNTNKYNYTEKPDTMNVSHILLKTEADAKKVLGLIKGGMKFQDAAKKYGTDGTKTTGGLLGDITYTSTDYDKDFVKGAIMTKTGTVSNPVKTQFGYHLIKINSRKEYKLKPLASVKASIRATLVDAKRKSLFNTAYTTWETKAKVEKHEELIQ